MRSTTVRLVQAPAAAMCRCDLEDCTGICDPSPASPRRSLLQRAVTAARRRVLQFQIRSTEKYLDEAAAAGILVGNVINEWHWQLHDLRARLAALQG